MRHALWVYLAEKMAMKAASYFFVGSEADVAGSSASFTTIMMPS